MVAQTRHGAQPSPARGKLAFSDKLISKGQSTDALLKKLKTVHTQLSQLDQEEVDINSLNTVRRELINTSIMLHKDRGVKAYAACCLADILRLYAPDAPYTQAELRDIFQFFFRQLLNGLKGTDASYYSEYFHLLESLSTVKSVVLVCDLENAEELMAEIFRGFFTIIKRDLAKKIELFMMDILVALIDECQTLPNEVLEIIMAQFMEKNARLDQPSYRLAVQVCNATADKLQRHVSQYFSDIITSHSREEEEFEEIRTAHDLIKRLHHSCPGLLHSVIPQLEEELRVEDNTVRLIATQVLGEMFADKGGPDLIRKYPSTWSFWLLRRNDKVNTIRLKFVDLAKGILANLNPEMRAVIEDALRSKLLDPDEKVRAAVCKVYSQLDYETALHHVSEQQLRAVAERGMDKKHVVRVEALNSLGKLYSLAYPEIEANDPAAIRQFAWIPNTVLQMTSVGNEVRAIVESVVADYILPLPTPVAGTSGKGLEVDEVSWTDRLLNTMKYLEEKSVNALLGLTGLRNLRPTLYEVYLECCIKNNGGIIDKDEERVKQRLRAVIQHIAGSFPDHQKATEDLNAFAKLNESRLYKLMKSCMDPQTDVKALIRATTEFERRLEQSASSSSTISSTMSIILRRASLRILNPSSIPTLLKRIHKSNANSSNEQAQAIALRAQTLLQFASKHLPAVYKSHIGELGRAILVGGGAGEERGKDKDRGLELSERELPVAEVALQALAGLVDWDASLFPSDKRLQDRIVRFALSPYPRHAKFAARILAVGEGDAATKIRSSLYRNIVEQLPNCDTELLVGRIAVLSQFAKCASDVFESRSDVVMPFLLKQVLMAPSFPPEGEEDDDEEGEEWAQDDELAPLTLAKLQALKVCRNRCLAYVKKNIPTATATATASTSASVKGKTSTEKSEEKAMEIATPVLKMLATMLDNNGTLLGDVVEDRKVRSRMRLQSAVSLLHMSTVNAYADALAPKFLRLAVTVQDPCFNVRIAFLSKLITILQPRKLPPRYNVIPFLTVQDPEADVKTMAASFITNALRKLPPAVRIEHLEVIFIRLLHLLAHHPDFSTGHEEMLDFAKYVQFYLDLVATPDTISLLYHLAMKGKTVRDADSHAHSENFYIMCELAQELIKGRARQHSWTIPSYPGRVKLPSDILRPLPNPESAKKIVSTTFLPEGILTAIRELGGKPAVQKERKDRKNAAAGAGEAKPTAGSKRKATARANGKKRAKRWKSDDEDDESEESDVSDSDMSVGMGYASAKRPPTSELEDNDEDAMDEDTNEEEEKLGRGARTRAKARQKRRAKAAARKQQQDQVQEPQGEDKENETPKAAAKGRGGRPRASDPKNRGPSSTASKGTKVDPKSHAKATSKVKMKLYDEEDDESPMSEVSDD